MNKKKTIIILSIIIIFVVIICLVLFKKDNIKGSNDDKINELYEYGNKLETMDILPNMIVARFNGEEILFREIETSRKSINFSIENGTKESEEKNAFYEVLVRKLYIELAKKYPNEVQYGLNIDSNMEKTKKEWLEGYNGKSVEEYRKEFLDILCIKEDEIWLNDDDFITYLQNISVEQMLETKGMNIVFKFMLEKPELAKDSILEEKVKTYKEMQEKQKEMIEQKNQEMVLSSTQDIYNLLTEIRELYIKDLIINSNIELCVDKGELSTRVPIIYSDDNSTDSIVTETKTSNTKNYDENIKIAYIDENKKDSSEFVYYNDSNKDKYNWNSYIIENKTITKNMEDIDLSKFEKLDNEFYSIKITDVKTYNNYAKKYNFRELKEKDFENIFVDIIIRESTDYSISYNDMVMGYENYDDSSNKGETNYTLPIKTGGILDVNENFKYPCMIGYFPNYMYKDYNSFYFKVLPVNNSISISSEKALQTAKNYLSKLSYGGVTDFSDKDYLRLSNEYENNFVDTENKEHPIIDENKKHTVWSISAYSTDDPCTWANVYIDVNTGKIIGGKLNFATD